MSDNTRGEPSIGSHVALGIFQTLNLAYDIVTLPLYTLCQMPWRHACARAKVFAVQVDPNDPSSPWVSTNKKKIDAFEGVSTVDQLTRRAIKRFGEKRCLGSREVFGEYEELQKDGKVFKKLDLGDYIWMTFNELDAALDLIGKGFLAMGVRPRQNVVIFADTRIEWILTAQALLRLNITVVTLYSTLGEDAIIHGINETESTHIVTSQELLAKVVNALPRMSSITHIIYMENLASRSTPEPIQGINLTSFTQLQEIGRNADPELIGEAPSGDDTAILMYTSGSTGVPKGVMISHKNIVTTARGFASILIGDNKSLNEERFIAYLPLAHVLELAAESLALAIGAEIGFSSTLTLTDRSTAIKKGQRGDSAILKPTIMAAVPLVLDRIKKGMTEAAHARGGFAGLFFDWAIAYKIRWQRWGYDTPLLNRFVFQKLRDAVGGRVQSIASGSAPLSSDTHRFVQAALCCGVVQGYGLTETTAGAAIMEKTDVTKGTVGAPLSGCFIKLVNWDEAGYRVTDTPNPRGEIVVGGDSVAKGYYKNEQLTAENFRTENGTRWFYSGDIGEIFPNGDIKIIDRKKDLVKLQYGEYVSLGKIETEMKTIPFVDNICVVGSSFHTYLIALISPNLKALGQIAQQMGKESLTTQQICNDIDVVNFVTKQIVEHGKKVGLHKMEIPLKIKLCHEEWGPESGLVTAAMKIRRKEIELFYRNDINTLYGTATSSSTAKSP